MRVLLGCGDYSTISGVPMFIHTLGTELVKRGHDVQVLAPNVQGVVAQKSRDAGMTVNEFGTSFKKTPWDVAHVSGLHAGQWASHSLKCPVVATVHSTLIYETPYLHDRIRHYACVRPQIMDKIIDHDGVPSHKTSLVFNGVDTERFKPSEDKFPVPTVLFAGTVDYLRAQATGRVLDLAKEREWRVLFMGRKLSGQMDNLPSHARYLEGDCWEIEDVLRQCIATAGILLGRTTIEGWWCDLPGIVYDIDNDGNVTGWGEHVKPPVALMQMFDVRFMANQYEKMYERIQ